MTGPATLSMGHRALVAYRQPDWTFTLRYAHWGENLASDIGPEAPLGGPVERPDTTPVADRVDVDPRGGYGPPVVTRVDPRPLATGATAEEVVDAVDAGYESLVVVSQCYEATPYLVCSLEPTPTGTDLAFARPDGDPDSLRSWFVEVKSRISAAVADGSLSREAGRATLRRALSARATVFPTDDASFLRDR